MPHAVALAPTICVMGCAMAPVASHGMDQRISRRQFIRRLIRIARLVDVARLSAKH